MIFIFAMFLCAWIQTHNDTPAWVYAAVLSLGSAAIGIFTGGDLVGNAIYGGSAMDFVVVLLFIGLFFRKRDCLVGDFDFGAAAMYALPLILLSAASQMVGASA